MDGFEVINRRFARYVLDNAPLEELATNLSFDQIMREPPAARYRLMELMRVSKKECEVKILINALSRVRSKQIEVALPGDLLDEKGGNQ